MKRSELTDAGIPSQDGNRLGGIMDGILEAERRQKNPVIAIFESLERYITEFESTLSDAQEVGARLVCFGQDLLLHVRQIAYSSPHLIVFDGHLDGRGDRVRLVQHVNQLSFLLVAVARTTESPRQPVGFVRVD